MDILLWNYFCQYFPFLLWVHDILSEKKKLVTYWKKKLKSEQLTSQCDWEIKNNSRGIKYLAYQPTFHWLLSPMSSLDFVSNFSSTIVHCSTANQSHLYPEFLRRLPVLVSDSLGQATLPFLHFETPVAISIHVMIKRKFWKNWLYGKRFPWAHLLLLLQPKVPVGYRIHYIRLK